MFSIIRTFKNSPFKRALQMNTAFLQSGMVVKHIKVNEQNRKKLEKMLNSPQRDWAAISMLIVVIAVAVVGLFLSL